MDVAYHARGVAVAVVELRPSARQLLTPSLALGTGGLGAEEQPARQES